jgi:hypothetical protein
MYTFFANPKMQEVAPKAALLSRYYEDALLDGLLEWRGAGDADPINRRTSAMAVGVLLRYDIFLHSH